MLRDFTKEGLQHQSMERESRKRFDSAPSVHKHLPSQDRSQPEQGGSGFILIIPCALVIYILWKYLL